MDFDVAYSDDNYSNLAIFAPPAAVSSVLNRRKYQREIATGRSETERLRAEADRLIAEAKQKALEADRIAKEEADKAAAALRESEAAKKAMQAAEETLQAATDSVASQSVPQAKKFAPYIVGGAIVLGLFLLLRK